MNSLSINKSTSFYQRMLLTLICLSFALLLAQPIFAIVYTSTNEAEGSRVITFDISPDSDNLIEIGSFPTGGSGMGTSIGNQSTLTSDASIRWMFVTNAGDGTINSFLSRESSAIDQDL